MPHIMVRSVTPGVMVCSRLNVVFGSTPHWDVPMTSPVLMWDSASSTDIRLLLYSAKY